jgi:hypothetical protein
LLATIAAALAIAGCGRGADLAPVTGRVTLEGKPVPNMIVNFTPLGDTGGNGALGHTDSDGRFMLLDARSEPGAHVGEYKISFYPGASRTQQTDPALDVISVPSRGGLPAVYLDPDNTPLRAAVPKGGASIELALTQSGTGAGVKVSPR